MAVRRKKKTVKKKSKPGHGEIVLPTTPQAIAKYLHDFLQLWYGVEKVGKTAVASRFPDALFLMFEPGGKAVKIKQLACPDWITFKKIVKAVIESDLYSNVIMDTGDIAYDRCLEYVCTKLAIDHPSDEDYGKGWTAVKQEFNKVILDLVNSGRGVIFLSHRKVVEIKTRKAGSEFNRIQPSLSKQAMNVIEPLVDIIAHFYFDEQGNRVIRIVGDELIAAGHRLGEDAGRFKYTDGTAIETIPMGKDADEAYANFVAAFDNKLTPSGIKGGKKTARRKVARRRS